MVAIGRRLRARSLGVLVGGSVLAALSVAVVGLARNCWVIGGAGPWSQTELRSVGSHGAAGLRGTGRAGAANLRRRAALQEVSETAKTFDDTLFFLASAIVIAPLCKALKFSPVLGYLIAGFVLGPQGLKLFDDVESIDELAEIGILFLLFEQGLELSSERLQKLSKYAFGLGTLQVIGSAAIIAAILGLGGSAFLDSVGTIDLRFNTRLDQLVVIGISLALSSSAFILKVLQELKLAPTLIGQAALGVLLFQDISVVPLLVLLPVIEDTSGTGLDGASLAIFLVQAIGGLLALTFGGGYITRQLYSVIAATKSPETFVALTILCVLGMSKLTEVLGLSNTLGAFLAGTLLAESNFRTQIEADVMPFRGLLLGLFFLTTGAQVEPGILVQEWPVSLSLLFGLLGIKAAVVAASGPFFGLAPREAVRLGCILAGGGEFAFVTFTLAGKLGVLPAATVKLLRGVVVVAMALTPVLASLGEQLASLLPEEDNKQEGGDTTTVLDAQLTTESSASIVLVCGMDPVGQQVASFLTNLQSVGIQWIGLDMDARRVQELRDLQQPVFYGDGSKLAVLTAAGVVAQPRVIVIGYSDPEETAVALERLRYSFPGTPILTHASDTDEFSKLSEIMREESGSEGGSARTDAETQGGQVTVVKAATETGMQLGVEILKRLDEIPTNIGVQLSEQLRAETQRRLLDGAAQAAASPEADKEGAEDAQSDVALYFVGRTGGIGADEELDGLPWMAAGNGSAVGSESFEAAQRALASMESLSLLEVMSGSGLSELAAKVKGADGSAIEIGLTEKTFKAGEQIIRYGEMGEEMFIVADGVCEASRPSAPGGPEQVTGSFGPGEYFGEVALLLSQPRAANVYAKTDTKVFSVDRATFQQLVDRGGLTVEDLDKRMRLMGYADVPEVLPPLAGKA